MGKMIMSPEWEAVPCRIWMYSYLPVIELISPSDISFCGSLLNWFLPYVDNLDADMYNTVRFCPGSSLLGRLLESRLPR